ncbi:MAG: hypothetical protein ACK4L7_00905, partial [Flavobacteriales bacterium]
MNEGARIERRHRTGRARMAALGASLAMRALACGQDIHFSQFFNVPLALNPACIGQFDGDHRAHGVFR